MRHSALSEGGTPPPQPLPGDLLRGRHFFDGGLRGPGAGHMALPAVHGDHDLRRSDRVTYAGETFRAPLMVVEGGWFGRPVASRQQSAEHLI